jgi:hypothetical protein
MARATGGLAALAGFMAIVRPVLGSDYPAFGSSYAPIGKNDREKVG